MRELWHPVVGWEDLYLVSSLGRIKSQDRITSTIGRWGTPQRNHYKGKIIKPVKASGHYRVRLARDGSAFTKMVHQLVLEAFVGPRPDGLIACHGPRGQWCNELSNLSWGTYSQNNNADRLRDGTDHRGEKGPMTKLTQSQVDAIRIDSRFQSEIAKDYGIKQPQVSRIKNTICWNC